MKNNRTPINSFGKNKPTYQVKPPKHEPPRYIKNSRKNKRVVTPEEMKEMQIRLILILLVSLTPIILGLTLYTQLPEEVPMQIGGNSFTSATLKLSPYMAVVGVPMLCGIASATIFFFSLRGNQDEAVGFEVLEWLPPFACHVYLPSVLFLAILNGDYVKFLLPDLFAMALVGLGMYSGMLKKEQIGPLPLPWAGQPEKVTERLKRISKPLWILGGLLLLCATGLFYPYWPLLLAMEAAVLLFPYLMLRSVKKES